MFLLPYSFPPNGIYHTKHLDTVYLGKCSMQFVWLAMSNEHRNTRFSFPVYIVGLLPNVFQCSFLIAVSPYNSQCGNVQQASLEAQPAQKLRRSQSNLYITLCAFH